LRDWQRVGVWYLISDEVQAGTRPDFALVDHWNSITLRAFASAETFSFQSSNLYEAERSSSDAAAIQPGITARRANGAR
jgi:hypothetical protein